jgi:GntR family transcriptional regulator, L-lactate dehydrogenase operon regulator
MSPASVDEISRLPGELFFRPLRTRNLFEETLARLGQAIRLGAIPIGERLPTERELHERLGVSRITIREALRALERAGYIEVRRGRNGGAYVLRTDAPEPETDDWSTAEQLQSAIDFRRAIEPTIAELAAKRRDDQALGLAGELLKSSEEVELTAYRAADSRFHLALAAMADSPSLAAASADVQLQHTEIITSRRLFLPESMRHSHEQHHKILEAIRERDSVSARVAMVEHLEASELIVQGLY